MTCPVCGTVPVPGARFCHACGQALPAAEGLPANERRVVTVLFGDLSEFTAWAEDTDPERVGAVTDRVLATLARAVTTFGGHVDKLTGDGIMAVFGAPVAHEDDNERAVRTALAMQRAVRRVLEAEQGGGVPLGLRVGLNTGVVVAGVQASLEYTVIGDTVNTAARLADAATVGTVYAGASTVAATWRLAAWRQLRPLRLKGKRAPVEAYELLGLRDTPGSRPGLGDEAPFLGRETDLGRFGSRLTEVVDQRQPRVLVLTAEAGVGKTRYGAEAARLATERGARVLSVHCAAYGERRRLAPLADLVRAVAGLANSAGGTVSRSTAADRLRRLVGQPTRRSGAELPGAADVAAASAVPAGVLSAGLVPGNDRAGNDRAGATVPVDLLLALIGYGELPTRRAERPAALARDGVDLPAVPGAVAELLSALARETPLVIVVDDLHDATPDTLEALGATLSDIEGPVFALLLGRPELVRGPAGVLGRIPDAEVHTLPPLRGAGAAKLLTAYLGGGRLGTADEGRLLATAQGNPFYLAELVTLLIERGLLTRDGDTWRLAPNSLSGRLLSRDLAAVLASRIDALPPAARAVLRDAAVVGDAVPAGALEALRGGSSGVPAIQLEQAVDELLSRRMLRRTDRGGYEFVTPLMRQAAYAGIGKTVVAAGHARLARWAAEQSRGLSETERDALVAEHAAQAVRLAETVGLRADSDARAVAPLGMAALGRAARRALADGEPALAARYADRGASLAGDDLPATDRLVHVRALLQLGQPDDALQYAEKVAADAISDAQRVTALLLAGDAHRALSDTDRAATAWREARQVAERAGFAHERNEALCRLGMVDYLAGRLGEAEKGFRAAYRVALEADDRAGQAWALQHLAWVTTTRADFTATDEALRRAARLFAEIDDSTGRAWVRGTTAFACLLAGRLHEARRLAQTFLPFGERFGEVWAVGTLRSVAAYAAAELGDLDEAQASAQRAYKEFDAAGDAWGRGFALAVQGVVARGRGDLEAAVRHLSDSLRHSQQAGHPLLVGIARVTRALCRLDADDPAAAWTDAKAIVALVEPYDVLPAAVVGPVSVIAQVKLAQGDAASAVRLLAGIVDKPSTDDDTPPAPETSLLYPRRHALSVYAEALLATGEVTQALEWARHALAVPDEDIRSEVRALRTLARVLAAAGDAAGAREAALQAVDAASRTDHLGERAANDALLALLP